MLTKNGIPVSPGVVISRAVVLDAEDVAIPRRAVALDKLHAEHKRLDAAIEASKKDLDLLKKQAIATVGADLAKVFDAHLAMLKDVSTIEQVRQMIRDDMVTAEFAVFTVFHKIADVFEGQEDRYFRERVSDIRDLERRLLGHLIGETRANLDRLEHEAILVAHDLTPSQTAALDKTKIKGIATDAGGRTSHTAILAHALGIPAVVGLENITTLVNTGQLLVLDGNRGRVIIDPDAAELLQSREYGKKVANLESMLVEVTKLPARTTDGTDLEINANIEFPDEIEAALQKGAAGIGLYRTEFLFLSCNHEPTEEEQCKAYKQALRALRGKTLIIRTLDLGADKIWPAAMANPHVERNPFLGCRSIRLCLQNLPLFKTQLRAILRASVEGPLRIMFPLISNVMELRQARMILNDVMEDLDDQNIAYRPDIPVGIMIEVPSAALQANILAREVDFFSIGTNDLIQYTVAVDRSNERIANLYSGAHPAVLQLIRDVVRAAKRAKIDVSLCGEMAGEPEFVMALVGMGLRSLSMTPPAIPEVKKILRSVSIEKCRRLARKVSSFESDRQVLNYLREEVRKILPEGLVSGGMMGN
ncbi:MAG: phosphoenolpyruvate--protein phosphotransferase [Phycisphaeraceae bacterium]|nr:phosphoenolpyruvate--protein phosphotransferase [Phycisphaeraceae bacterium]